MAYSSLEKSDVEEDALPNLPTGAVKSLVDQLGYDIANGQYSESGRLPLEADLALSFGVSRTALREAIKVLSGKGMVKTARRYGTKVLDFPSWNLLDADVLRWSQTNAQIAPLLRRHASEMRLIFEPQAAALAALRATDAQKIQIAKAAQNIMPGVDGYEPMIAADYLFHATIIEATDNHMLKQLKSVLFPLIRISYPERRAKLDIDNCSRKMHIEVATAILQSDPERAREKMHEMFIMHQNLSENDYQPR